MDLTVHQIRLPEGHLKELYKASGTKMLIMCLMEKTILYSYIFLIVPCVSSSYFSSELPLNSINCTACLCTLLYCSPYILIK